MLIKAHPRVRLFFCAGAATGEENEMAEAMHHRIEVGAVSLHASSWGRLDGPLPPIVLLHDSLGAVSLWRDFPLQLSQRSGRAVVAYDRYGFGQSSARQDRLATGFIAGEARPWLQAVLQQLGLAQVVLFGHSVGGGMAVSAAAAMPEQVVAVITESAQAFVEDRTLQGIRQAHQQFADPAQLARLARHHGQDPGQAQWVLDAWTETWLAPQFANWSLALPLARLRCPVLAIHGDQDEYGSLAHPAMIATQPQAFPGQGHSLILQGCGHVPHREQPDAVLRAVVDFLR